MKYFLIKEDFEWSWQNGVECYTDSIWRMPGIYCPAHPRVATYIDGYSYPAADFANDTFLKRALHWELDVSNRETEWQEKWKEPARWRDLRQKVISALPYEVPIAPGTSFGPVTARISGKPADWHPGEHVLLSGSALERLRGKGIGDLFAVPCVVRSKRKRDPYYELQIEHQAELAGSLDSSKLKYRRELGYPLKCAQCGSQRGRLPKRVILRGDTIPEGISLFRLKNRPTAVFCSQEFAKAATELKLTNLVFVSVRTDGSEKKHRLAQVALSRPELWPGAVQAVVPPRKVMKRIPSRRMPRFDSAPALIAKARLGVNDAELTRLVRPSLRFMANPADDLPFGQSRFGGLPDLPKGLAWPAPAKAALDFLVQFNLAEVALNLPEAPLPKSGLLSFFYDSENCPWGTSLNDKKGWKVLFHDGPVSKLVRSPLPNSLSSDSVLPSCLLEFSKLDSLPELNSPALQSLKLAQKDCERYSKVLRQTRWGHGKEVPVHRLLGYPDTIQDDMAVACAMASGGLDMNHRPDVKNPRERRIAEGAQDWTFLLQIDSEERLGMGWADAGRLYYWIRKQDLAARRFDRCWAVLQSY